MNSSRTERINSLRAKAFALRLVPLIFYTDDTLLGGAADLGGDGTGAVAHGGDGAVRGHGGH